jgi:hypothetical protein
LLATDFEPGASAAAIAAAALELATAFEQGASTAAFASAAAIL